MSLLIPIEAFDNFREVKDFPADGISPKVLPELVRVVKRLDEREELEPLLRSILTDTEQTPHGPAEIADVIPDTNPTQKRPQNGEANEQRRTNKPASGTTQDLGPIEMSNRTINYYEFPDREPDWVKLKQMFKRNVSKYNVPFFEADSALEGDFARFCQAFNLALHKKTIIEYDGKDPDADKFLFLCLKDDDGACISESGQGFLDLSAACPGGGPFGSCGRGAKQVDKVLVKPGGVQRVTSLGLLTSRHPNVPRVFLTSTTVGEALGKAGASGCEIVPTNTPNCCQLRITAETAGPARIGHARMGKRCPVCGTAKLFIGSSERYFRTGDLKPTDFQICRVYAADSVGQFEILNGYPIVSQRIFNLLLELKIEGLDRYSTDPQSSTQSSSSATCEIAGLPPNRATELTALRRRGQL